MTLRPAAGPAADGRGGERPPSVWPAEPRAAEGQPGAARLAIAAERARIARDLHDSVDMSLHGLAVAAETLAESATATDEPDGLASLRPRLHELANIARCAISQTRCVVYDLRDDGLSVPLGGALRNLASTWSAGSGVPLTLAVPPGTDTSRERRRELVAITREALRNVQAHAHASRVRISLRQAPQRLLLTICDNGTGFALPTGPESLHAAACYGLTGMTERARKLGGTLVIRSRPGYGTRIAVQVPAGAEAPVATPPDTPPGSLA